MPGCGVEYRVAERTYSSRCAICRVFVINRAQRKASDGLSSSRGHRRGNDSRLAVLA